jgi:DNA-binding beta-propeller fold protein YncE
VTHLDGGAPDELNGYSELTVIDLSATPPKSTRLSVGFRPSQVVFDRAAGHAFAVVDEGISVITLGKIPALSALLAVSSAGLSARARDVNIAPDGSFAVVRVDGRPEIEIIDLATDARQVLTLESNVTDLDLSADGKHATAVLGDATPAEVVSFALPTLGGEPAQFERAAIPGELVRSVTLAPSDQLALLYANAVPSSHLTLLDTAPGEHHFGFRTVDVQGAVRGVYVAPDSATAITFQTPPAGSKKKGLFSIVPTQAVRSPRIVGTDATPTEIAFSDADTGKALVTVHDSSSAVRGVYVIGLANLEQNFVQLASEPLPGATGIVPLAKRGFVAQKHPEGRITFIDLETGAAQTLSGFEIAARVVGL